MLHHKNLSNKVSRISYKILFPLYQLTNFAIRKLKVRGTNYKSANDEEKLRGADSCLFYIGYSGNFSMILIVKSYKLKFQ